MQTTSTAVAAAAATTTTDYKHRKKHKNNIYRVSLTNRHQWYNKYFATGTLQTTNEINIT